MNQNFQCKSKLNIYQYTNLFPLIGNSIGIILILLSIDFNLKNFEFYYDYVLLILYIICETLLITIVTLFSLQIFNKKMISLIILNSIIIGISYIFFIIKILNYNFSPLTWNFIYDPIKSNFSSDFIDLGFYLNFYSGLIYISILRLNILKIQRPDQDSQPIIIKGVNDTGTSNSFSQYLSIFLILLGLGIIFLTSTIVFSLEFYTEGFNSSFFLYFFVSNFAGIICGYGFLFQIIERFKEYIKKNFKEFGKKISFFEFFNKKKRAFFFIPLLLAIIIIFLIIPQIYFGFQFKTLIYIFGNIAIFIICTYLILFTNLMILPQFVIINQ